MKRLAFVVLLTALLAVPGWAGPKKPKLPKITGGGIVQNFNSMSPYGTVLVYTIGGFNAQATDEGTVVPFPPFAGTATTYPAKGQVQANFAPVDDPSGGTNVHGKVVCIANLGASADVDGDDSHDDAVADPAGDVWEVRFEVTRIDGEAPDFPAPIYGSVFFQDGGKADFGDETFSRATLLNPACAVNPFFGLEPFLAGNVKVH